jgi:hypothetical protein
MSKPSYEIRRAMNPVGGKRWLVCRIHDPCLFVYRIYDPCNFGPFVYAHALRFLENRL